VSFGGINFERDLVISGIDSKGVFLIQAYLHRKVRYVLDLLFIILKWVKETNDNVDKW